MLEKGGGGHMRWPCVFLGLRPFLSKEEECVGRILIECVHTDISLGALICSLVRLIQGMCMLYQKMACFFAGMR